MKLTPLMLALLLCSASWADTMPSYAVSNTTPTQVFAPSAGSLSRHSLKVINRGANTIYCSPSSSVTTDTGDPIASGQTAVFPAVPVWCIAGTAAQTGTGTDRTLVWESDL